MKKVLFFASLFICFSSIHAQTIHQLVDERDGQSYEIVQIDSLWWLNENLNFASPKSFCYDEAETFCEQFGRLYKYEVIHEACPDSWRIPTETEMMSLVFKLDDATWRKTQQVEGTWQDWGKGKNALGWKLLPSGWKDKKKYEGMGKSMHLWVKDDKDDRKAGHVHMHPPRKKWDIGERLVFFIHFHEMKNPIAHRRLFAIRCVKAVE